MNRIYAAPILLAVTLGAGAQPSTNAVASPDQSRPVSLKDCIQLALTHNFDVRIQRFNPVIEFNALRADYGGYDPSLTVSGKASHNNVGQWTQVTSTNGVSSYVVVPQISDVDAFNSAVGGSTPWGLQYNLSGDVAQTEFNSPGSPASENASGQIGASVTQPLLKNFWIDTTRMTIQVAKNRLRYSEQGLRLQLITTVAAVQTAYDELIYAQENVKVQQEALTLAQTQLDQDRQRVVVGSLAPLDVQQDEAQAASSQASLIAARNTLSVDQNTLKNLLTDDYAHWYKTNLQPTETLSAVLQLFDLQDCWGKGLTKRPDLLQARLNADQQGITLKFDRNQLYPELDLQATYGYNGSGHVYSGAFDQYAEADHPYYSYGASISIPLDNTRARNTLKADKATFEQELLTLKQLEQTVMVGIENAVQQVASDYEGVQASKQARIYAEAALDAEQKKYSVGKSTTFTVLQLQSTLTTDRGAEIRSIANYNEDLAKLAQQEGTTLDELNINLELQ
jgi:HAE1 family hydrophobic/amphiphilic exporter-1